MIKILDKHKCCGCGACVQRCPKQCITLRVDNEGFLYPHVSKDLCIDCGLCEKVCPFINPYQAHEPLQTLAANNKNDEVRLKSSSGGIFSVLAEKVISEGGIVFGARFDDQWQVVIDYAETLDGIAAFRGSKYIQATTGDIFKKCEKFLKAGRKVLYTGSPCQIAGLKHFLRNEYDNLLLVDFGCHGVPSPKVWRMYLDEIVGSRDINRARMRAKTKGWRKFNFEMSFNKDNNTIILSSPASENDYMSAFLQNLILRPSCHNCKAKECRSHSDITIADYWGIWNVAPEMYDDKGTGLVLIHTEKGKIAFPIEQTNYIETTYAQATAGNSALLKCPLPHKNRSEFFAKIDSTNRLCSLIRKNLRPKGGGLIKYYIKLIFKWMRNTYINLFVGGNVLKYNILQMSYVNFRNKSNSWKRYWIILELKIK